MLSRSHRKLEDYADAMIAALGNLPTARDELDEALAFFDSSAVNHVADEEMSLFPHLAPSPLIERLTREHREQEALLEELKRALREGGDALSVAERLAAAYRAHTDLEDRELLPALDALSPEIRKAVVDDMRARRGR